MKQIPNDPTILSIITFIKGLNEEQKESFYIRLVEKQPHLFTMMGSVPDITQVDCINTLNYLFGLILRSFEYEFGEIPMISLETINEFNDEMEIAINRELKTSSPYKSVRNFKRNVHQNDLTDYVDSILEGTKESPATFPADILPAIKISIYFVIDLLNREVQKMDGHS
jgi:hypothetical protein